MTIQDLINKYKGKLDYLDAEILIAHSLGKTREFVLTYPEFEIPSLKIENLKLKISRRMRGEPIAYILGHKEFYGLDFNVDKSTLVPRPETEMIVDEVIHGSWIMDHGSKNTHIIDIGTGSGCIIVSIASNICHPEFISGSRIAKNKQPSEMLKQVQHDNIQFYATDISKEALKVAKKNAKKHNLDEKIKFLHGNLLEPFFKKSPIANRKSQIIITANLPYLSQEIYSSAPIDVKKFEPKTALYSRENGLQHYHELLLQIKKLLVPCSMLHVSCLMEISPEQKKPLAKLIRSILPAAEIEFQKDLARKWRVCKITI